MGRVLGGFWEDFSKICWIFLENADFVKTLKKPWFLQCFVRGKLLKNHKNQPKIDKKIHANFEWQKKNPKMASEVDLGGSGTPFGRGLGQSAASFGRSWASFACLVGRLELIRLDVIW